MALDKGRPADIEGLVPDVLAIRPAFAKRRLALVHRTAAAVPWIMMSGRHGYSADSSYFEEMLRIIGSLKLLRTTHQSAPGGPLESNGAQGELAGRAFAFS